jgi:hypothetical protein
VGHLRNTRLECLCHYLRCCCYFLDHNHCPACISSYIPIRTAPPKAAPAITAVLVRVEVSAADAVLDVFWSVLLVELLVVFVL